MTTIDDRASWDQARRIAFEAASPRPDELVPLAHAVGRRLSRDLVGLCDLPHYASSAMDGWAIAGAPPWTIVERADLIPGQCTPIATGGIIPAGAGAVLRSEHAIRTREGADELISPAPDARDDEPRDGEHIRAAATEARIGEVIIRAGLLLNPAHVALAASAGHDAVRVFSRPGVGLILTGDEVVRAGIPAGGEVRDSFGPVLPSILGALMATTTGCVLLGDSSAALADAIRDQPAGTDVIITTGGTGASDADHLRRTLAELGATIIVDGIRMRPGGPSLLARMRDGRFLIGLPGNPLAAMMGMIALADPLLTALSGGGMRGPHRVRVDEAIVGRPGTSLLIPYRIRDGRAGAVEHRGAAMMRGLASSDGILICPAEGVPAGGWADGIGLPWIALS